MHSCSAQAWRQRRISPGCRRHTFQTRLCATPPLSAGIIRLLSLSPRGSLESLWSVMAPPWELEAGGPHLNLLTISTSRWMALKVGGKGILIYCTSCLKITMRPRSTKSLTLPTTILPFTTTLSIGITRICVNSGNS